MTFFVNGTQEGDAARRSRDVVIRCALAPAPRTVSIGAAAVDDVLAIASTYALAPRVASRLSREGLSTGDVERLDALLAECAARNAILQHDAALAVGRLHDAGIPSVLLKGAALFAQGLAAEPGDRHMDDVDVLVRESDARRAARVLSAAGYTRAGSMHRVVYDGGTREELAPPGEHSLVTLVSPLGSEIDLHFAAPDSRVSDLDAVSAYCVDASIGGQAVRVPAPPLLLAHLCEHVARHHAMLPRYVPRHLADAATIAAAVGDGVWDAASELSDPVSVRLSRLLVAASGASDAVGRFLLPGPRDARARELLIETARMAGRIGFDLVHDRTRLARKLVPARAFIASTYGVAEDDPRLPWYYAHRLLSLRWLLKPYRG